MGLEEYNCETTEDSSKELYDSEIANASLDDNESTSEFKNKRKLKSSKLKFNYS